MRLQNLSDVHTRRNAERIQNDLDRSAVRHVRHIFLRHDAGNDALVAMAAGHLVADGKLALHGDVHLDQLDDARGQLVALLELVLALFGDLAQHVDLARGHFLDFLDLLDEKRSFSLSFRRLRLRVEIFSMISRVSSTPLVSRRLLVFSSCRSAWSTLPPRRSVRRLRRSSVRMRISSARFFSSLKTCVASMALCRSSFSPPLRVKILTSTMVPSMPGGRYSEASRTSPAFSPKMARRSFSSGVSVVSPFGVTLPTRMSPGFTTAPMRMTPLSSRLRRNDSLMFGMSRVTSSGPSLVSRASISYSSMWIEV